MSENKNQPFGSDQNVKALMDDGAIITFRNREAAERDEHVKGIEQKTTPRQCRYF